MGVRFRNEFYTDQNVRYRVDIWDSDWASGITTLEKSGGFEIEYERLERFLSPLMPSSCYYKIYDYGLADMIGFKADLANAQEDEFKLIVYKHNGADWIIHWAGIIMSDLVSWDNDVAPRVLEIVAKCGLNRLEGIYFDKIYSSPYSTQYQASVKQIIFDCLSYAGTAQFWNGSTKPYINANMQWRDTLQTSINQQRVLETIYVGKEYLVDDPRYNDDYTQIFLRGDNDPPLKANEILYDICQVFGLRIFQSDGSWQVQQVHKQASDTSYVGKYDYSGTYLTSGLQTIKLTENRATAKTLCLLANGKFGYYPPVKLAKAKILPSQILNGNYGLWTLINKDNQTFTSSTFQLGTLYGGTDLSLQINIFVNIRSMSIFSTDFYVEVTAKLTAGTHRIKNSVTSPDNGGEAIWTTSSADKYIFDLGNPSKVYGTGENINNKGFAITIQPNTDIPFAKEENCTLVIEATLKSRTGKTNWPSKAYFNLELREVAVGLYDLAQDPPAYAQVSQLEKTNSTLSANSIEIDYGLLRIADTLGTRTQASFNTLMVEAPTNGGTQSGSTTWVAGFPTDEDLVSTLLKETLSLQNTAIRKYTGPFRSTIYEAWNTILYDSTIWVFMGGRYSANDDKWDGEWFGIARDLSSSFDNAKRANSVKDGNWKPFIPTGAVTPERNLPQGPNHVARITDKITQGTGITVIDIASDQNHGKKGDQMIILNPVTMEQIQTIELDEDIISGQTTVDVVSTTASEDLWQSQIFAHDPRKNVVSDNGRFTTIQTGQGSTNFAFEWVLKATTSNSTPKEATFDGGVATTANTILVPTDCAISMTVTYVAKKIASDDYSSEAHNFVIINDGGTTTISTVHNFGTPIQSAGMAAVSIACTAEDSDDRLAVTVTGLAATVIGWTVLVKGILIEK